LKIVFQHDHPLPVKKYGGIERILFWHMKELARAGHDVILIGHPESTVEKDQIKLIPMDGKDWYHLIPKDADIIHLSYNHIVPCDIPTLITLHGNGQPGEIFPENTVFLTNKHAQNHGGDVFVFNALDLEEYPFKEKKLSWDRFLFLAKGSWKVKNLKDCVKAVKASHKKLEVIGGSSFFPKKNINYHGFLDGQIKLDIMNSADALLYPVRWHEPFGLAIIEAMSQGLPAVTSSFGSFKELIHEDTGIICSNYQEFEHTIRDNKKEFSSKTIRNYVEDKFAMRKYSADYVTLYERVISGEKLHQKKLGWVHQDPPQKLLDF
jgi:glycosyltransferase involved in cell wall biosynthesis